MFRWRPQGNHPVFSVNTLRATSACVFPGTGAILPTLEKLSLQFSELFQLQQGLSNLARMVIQGAMKIL